MEEAADKNLVVGLGFDAARGYALADQTSPALAGAAGALTDTTMTGEQVTELRIHGVSGSNGPTMLEHPQALQVAKDAGLSRESLYRALSAEGNPSFATILKVAKALGLKLHAMRAD